MSGHTPGPWVLDGFNMSSVLHCTAERGSPEAKHISGDYETVARCEGDNWAANARLIAAAPELLDALITALPYVEEAEPDQAYKAGSVRKVINQMREAISKASPSQSSSEGK